MKKALASSLFAAEITAFAMLMLLFYLNTDKPYLLLVPIAEGIGGYAVFKLLLRRTSDKGASRAASLAAATSILLGILIVVSVVALAYVSLI
jgi:hypothetical protein